MSPFRPQPLFNTPDPVFTESPDVVSPTLADVFRRYGGAYLAIHSVTSQQHQVMDAIRHCRTFELGYHDAPGGDQQSADSLHGRWGGDSLHVQTL